MATTETASRPGTLCPECGTALPVDARSCPHCGVDLVLLALLAERAYIQGLPENAPAQPPSPGVVPRIGEYLIEQGLITAQQLEGALARQKENAARGQRRFLGQTLVAMGHIDRETLDRAITRQIIELHAALQEANRSLERRVAERTAELRRALARLTELNQIKANLISNVSHELRTPLAQIKGYVELIQDEHLGALTEEQRKGVAVLHRATARLEQLIEDLLGFSTASREGMTLHLEPVHLPALVTDVLGRTREKADKAGVLLESRVPPDLPAVNADPEKIGWVLYQLIDNGIKFSPSGGRVTLSAAAEAGAVTLAVADTGIGIPPERVEEIFEAFHQLDGSPTRRYGGTGLGLALVKLILNAHNAPIHVESEEGKGTTLRFSLSKVA
jgi:signal transduction histidine kinase